MPEMLRQWRGVEGCFFFCPTDGGNSGIVDSLFQGNDV